MENSSVNRIILHNIVHIIVYMEDVMEGFISAREAS